MATRCKNSENKTTTYLALALAEYTETNINRKIAPHLVLEKISRGVGHCIAQHVENAVQCSAKLSVVPIVRSPGCQGHLAYVSPCLWHYANSGAIDYGAITSREIESKTRSVTFFSI